MVHQIPSAKQHQTSREAQRIVSFLGLPACLVWFGTFCIIQHSTSPWRTQVVDVKKPALPNKKRLCIDYSQTVNQYTEVDAYPLPRVDDMIINLAKYRVFSTFDLKNVYRQFPICDPHNKYTGFETNGRLYQFRRNPFGVTNGVVVFQRQMDRMIVEEQLYDTFPYLDDITVTGSTQEEHDSNMTAFLKVVSKGGGGSTL